MARRVKGAMHRLTQIMEIPQDIVLDLPRITMLGNKQLLVENHKGIIEYTSSILRIKLNQGELVIQGSALILAAIQEEQILVEGTVEEVRYDI